MKVIFLFFLVFLIVKSEEKLGFEKFEKQGNENLRKSKYRKAIGNYTKALSFLDEKDFNHQKIKYKRSEVYYLNKDYEFSIRDLQSLKSNLDTIEFADKEKVNRLKKQVLGLLVKVYLHDGKILDAKTTMEEFYIEIKPEIEKYEKNELSKSDTRRIKRILEQKTKVEECSSLYDSIKSCTTIDDLLKKGQENQEEEKGKRKTLTEEEKGKLILEEEERLKTANTCFDNLNKIIKQCSYSNLGFRLSSVISALDTGNYKFVQKETNHIFRQFDRTNPEALFLHSKYMNKLGSWDNAKDDLRKCLNLDPDNKICKMEWRIIKRNMRILAKANEFYEAGKWWKMVKKYQDYLQKNNGNTGIILIDSKISEYNLASERICKGYTMVKNFKRGLEACDRCLANNTECLFNTMELHLQQEDNEEKHLEEVEKIMKIIVELNNQGGSDVDENKIEEYQQKIQRLKKKLTRKDYYKILGISKRATTREIKQAYRKMSKFHPDRAKTDEEKEEYQKIFMDVNEAYEILKDDEKRRRYDAGDDVEDINSGRPSQPQGGFFRGGGFPGGFNFGQGGGGFPGGGNFKFHFQ